MSNRFTCQPHHRSAANLSMCWVDIPIPAVRDEVLARIESDPSAIERSRHAEPRWMRMLVLGFCAGFAVGWLCG